MINNEYFTKGYEVWIRFQEPAGIKEHLFCKVMKNKNWISDPAFWDVAGNSRATYIANALNLQEPQ